HAIAGIRRAKVKNNTVISTNKTIDCNKFIAYFQSYTNTYAPLDYLKPLFTEAISHPDVVALSIGTRPDCLPEDVLDFLEELNRIKPVFVELGLQTIHEKTAQFIRRGYPLSVFDKAVDELQKRDILCVVHTILGLPFETREDILATMSYLAKLPIHGIKLQLLHVLKGTDLADHLGEFHIYTMEEYTDLLIECLEILPQDIVIHRITGDGPKSLLLEPAWSAHKKKVMNYINKTLKERDTWQGRRYEPSDKFKSRLRSI
ncbi:MAG: TIGR01212 family radical SAM protein, partial [Lachnospiraceae bacterium]|nr:TIGR01212 family radical SAM protein [Lachnospiraceae bacterium]